MTRRCAPFFVALTVAAAVFAGRAEATPATDVVESFHAVLLQTMKEANTLGYRGRYMALEPAVERIFDLKEMARLAAGAYWTTFTDGQRAKLTDAFTRLTIATYAHRFDGYSGQLFRVKGETPSRRDAVLVATEIVKGNGEAVPITYYMRPGNGAWQAVDVFLKGAISELATRRSEYGSVLRRAGFDALIQAIEKKVAALESG